MSETTATLPPLDVTPKIRWRNLAWVALALAVMIVAIQGEELWFLNFVHVLAGILWTGIDLFMGFVMGPILRLVDVATRRAIVVRLMPRMLFLMPTLSSSDQRSDHLAGMLCGDRE